MSRKIYIGVGLAVAGVAGLAASSMLGSTPDEPGFEGPLPLCGDSSNCYRVRRVIAASPEEVRQAAEVAIRASRNWLTGEATRVTPTDDGFRAVIKVGPFYDDLQIAVVPGASGQSVLHVRSASRIGESDLGINRLRVRRILDAVTERAG